MKLNYAYLAKKYMHASVVVHDRSYDGLEWHGPGEKPSQEIFESFQKEEDRAMRVAGLNITPSAGLVEEKQKQAKARALEAIRPMEDRLREKYDETYAQTMEMKRKAIELAALMQEKELVLDCWREISSAQAAVSHEAQEYLDNTRQYLSWNPGDVPQEIIEKRKLAQARVLEGETVYADFSRLRAMELPSREEMADAIRKGGDHLKRMQEICKSVALRYPKPRKNHF